MCQDAEKKKNISFGMIMLVLYVCVSCFHRGKNHTKTITNFSMSYILHIHDLGKISKTLVKYFLPNTGVIFNICLLDTQEL